MQLVSLNICDICTEKIIWFQEIQQSQKIPTEV